MFGQKKGIKKDPSVSFKGLKRRTPRSVFYMVHGRVFTVSFVILHQLTSPSPLIKPAFF
jgi:hypothetical protein